MKYLFIVLLATQANAGEILIKDSPECHPILTCLETVGDTCPKVKIELKGTCTLETQNLDQIEKE